MQSYAKLCKAMQSYAKLLNLEEHARGFAKDTFIMVLVFSILVYYSPVLGAYHHGCFSLIFQSQSGSWVQHGPNILGATRNHPVNPSQMLYANPWQPHLKFAALLWQVQALIQSHFHKTKALLWKTLSRPQEPQAQWIQSDSGSKKLCL